LPKNFVGAIEASQPTWNENEGYYEIDNCTDLMWISNDPDNHYVLTSDINIQFGCFPSWLEFTPIYLKEGGILDGKNHKISSLILENENSDLPLGLFYQIDNGIVENIILENFYITGSNNFGALAGAVKGAEIKNISLVGSRITGKNYVGGLIGHIYETYVTDSKLTKIENITIVNSTIYGENYVGGILGMSDFVFYAENYHKIEISHIKITNLSITGNQCLGGVVGNIGREYGEFTTSNVDCSIDNVEINNLTINGNDNIGGIAGFLWEDEGMTNSSITNCILNNITINGSGDYIGGVGGKIGFEQFKIQPINMVRLYFTGTITGTNYVGGIVGGDMTSEFHPDIVYAYVNADISGINHVGGICGGSGSSSCCAVLGKINAYDYVGGILSEAFGYGGVGFSYCAAEINATNYAGALVGYTDYGSPRVHSSFWDINVVGLENAVGDGYEDITALGVSTENMKDVRTYTDNSEGFYPWDFAFNPYNDDQDNDIWGLNPDINNGYPFLTFFDGPPLGYTSDLTISNDTPPRDSEITITGIVRYAGYPYFAIETAVIHDSLIGDMEAAIDGSTYTVTYRVPKRVGETGYVHATGTGSSWQSNTIQYTIIPGSFIPPIIPEEDKEQPPIGGQPEEQPPPIEEQPPGVPVEPWYRQRDINLIPTFPPPVTPTETKTPIYYWIGALFPLLLLCALTFPKEEWENTYGNNTGGSPPGSWTFISGESVPLFMVDGCRSRHGICGTCLWSWILLHGLRSVPADIASYLHVRNSFKPRTACLHRH